jgi:hypothetical protein
VGFSHHTLFPLLHWVNSSALGFFWWL